MPKIGKNIQFEVKGDKLVIQMDIKKELGESKSGKSVNVATTNGNQPVGDTGLVLGLNLYKPKPKN